MKFGFVSELSIVSPCFLGYDGAMQTAKKEQFVVDSSGKKVGVILNVEEYRQLMEDLHDLAVIAERKRNPKISLKELRSRLKIKNG